MGAGLKGWEGPDYEATARRTRGPLRPQGVRTSPKYPAGLLLFPLLSLLVLTSPTFAALRPAPGIEGVLLASASLDQGSEETRGLELGLYGPKPALPDEPTSLSLLIQGNQSTTISSGVVLLACLQTGARLRASPPPGGAYIPFGQWSPDRESEWRQLVLLSPQGIWATRIVGLALQRFGGGAGALLDLTILSPDWPQPPADAIFRNFHEYEQMGAVFIADETMTAPRSPVQGPGAAGSWRRRGAHGVRLTFPMIFKDPATAISVWVALTVNGKLVTETLRVGTASSEQGSPAPSTSARGTPVVETPVEGAFVSDVVRVVGKTDPGMLAVAWVEAHDTTLPQAPAGGPITVAGPVRRVTDDTGHFTIDLPLLAAGPLVSSTLAYELHVRTEAPGYKSPEIIRHLKRQ